MTLTRKCEWCERDYTARPSRASRVALCSRQCWKAWKQKDRIGRNCAVCGKDFWPTPRQIRIGDGLFCSVACSVVARPRATKAAYVGAASNGRKREHVRIAEAALGKTLPNGAEVHHVNGDGRDNRPCNLVICQDRAYHKLLHKMARERAALVSA